MSQKNSISHKAFMLNVEALVHGSFNEELVDLIGELTELHYILNRNKNSESDNLMFRQKKSIISDTNTNNSNDKLKTIDIYDMALTDNFTEDINPKKNSNECDNCHKANTIHSNDKLGLIMCTNCGYVIENIIDDTLEDINYEDSNNNPRCSTIIDHLSQKGAPCIVLSGLNSRLNQRQKWSNGNAKDKANLEIIQIFDSICKNNSINKDISNTAKNTYFHISLSTYLTGKKAGKQIRTKADPRKGLMAACVHKSLEFHHKPRSYVTVANYFGIDKKRVTRAMKTVNNIIKDNPHLRYLNEIEHIDITIDYIKNVCKNENIFNIGNEKCSDHFMNMAISIAKNSERLKLATKYKPHCMAACAIYAMSKLSPYTVRKNVLAIILETSENSINKIYKEIYPHMSCLIEDKATTYIIEKMGLNNPNLSY
jgi:transcription initiation factor TFIIIB Brf1 subunit/transcription initiation factor TFIIB